MPQLMLASQKEQTGSRPTSLVLPSYVDVGGGRVLARFGSAVSTSNDSLELRRDRTRSYPGLVASAPRTDAFYRSFSPWTEGKDVLDVGCGAGAGLIYLDQARSIVGVDLADVAVWYARNSLPGVRFEQRDACKDELPKAGVAILVDVLGEAESPKEVLRRVGLALGEGGIVCVAEAHASIAQELLPPVRRAYSKFQLESLLLDGGYVIEEWISDGGFLALVARRSSTEWTRGIEAADQLRAEGLEEEGLDILRSPPKCSDDGAAAAWFLSVADICISRGEGDGALEALMEAQIRAPDDARVLASLAELTLAMGAKEDALRFSIAAAQRDAANPKVAHSLAESVAASLPVAEKIALWANASRLDPVSVDVAVSLARVAASHEAYHVGITALEKVREYHPRLSADFHLTLGWMYLMASRIEDALMECRLATVTEPESPAIAELLAAICEVRPRPAGVS